MSYIKIWLGVAALVAGFWGAFVGLAYALDHLPLKYAFGMILFIFVSLVSLLVWATEQGELK